jgi:hypothetical protein
MKHIDPFIDFWCTMVAIITVVNFAWAINDLNRGSTRFGWGGRRSDRISREEEPFEFWVAVGSKLIALPVGIFMIWFALSNFSH